MDVSLYSELNEKLKTSTEVFLVGGQELSSEIEEDVSEIIAVCDISKWSSNIDGVVKDVSCLLSDLEDANRNKDRQQCIESIAMLRVAIGDIESAFSNTLDSMESLVVSIRDEPND
jgi:hypothetical protein